MPSRIGTRRACTTGEGWSRLSSQVSCRVPECGGHGGHITALAATLRLRRPAPSHVAPAPATLQRPRDWSRSKPPVADDADIGQPGPSTCQISSARARCRCQMWRCSGGLESTAFAAWMARHARGEMLFVVFYDPHTKHRQAETIDQISALWGRPIRRRQISQTVLGHGSSLEPSSRSRGLLYMATAR